MKFQISPLIRKIANIGTTIALINNGADPQMATRYGQLAEGMLSGFTIEGGKEDVMTRMQKTFVDSTYKVLKYEMDIEIEYKTAEAIAKDLFDLNILSQYLETIDSETLLINRFKECCLEYNIPFIEQEIDINYIVEKIVIKINNYIINDIHFLLIILLVNSNESRKDIFDIKETLTNSDKKQKDIFKYNQKHLFINKWESNLFLHKHIRLCDIYTQPNFTCKQYKNSEIEKLILNFMADSNKPVLFLFGNPGLGKSSLMSNFANMFKNIENYIFIKMHDLEPRIAKDSLIDAIIDFLECKRRDLENTIIFLDGYDELRVDSKHYELCLELLTDLKQIRAKAIISSRLNYIDLNKTEFNRDFKNAVIVELQPYSKKQMFDYIETFEQISKQPIDKVKKSFNSKATEVEVYGIPFILYLICSLNIDISQMTDMQSIYDKVFSYEGGLYDKIYDEEAGHYLTQNPQCKRDLLQISMEIAYKMFSTNELFVEKKILDDEIIVKYPQRKSTYAIGNYYYIENDKLYFVHKTFQEYFVCRFILSTLENILAQYIDRNVEMEEATKCIFDMLYCDNYLFKRIEHVFSNMFINSQLMMKQYKVAFSEFIPCLYDLYLKNIYMETTAKNNILKSQNYLSSMCKIINFFKIDTFKGVEQYKISLILRSKFYVIISINNLRLSSSDLSGAYMRGSFNECCFIDVNFCRCDLHNSFLNYCEINNCKLSLIYGQNAYFNGTKMFGFELANSDLSKSKFNNTIFEESIITGVNFRYSSFTKCEFKKVRFVDCDFSYTAFSNIKGNIVFHKCIFGESELWDIEGDVCFNECNDDYELLYSENDDKEDYVDVINEDADE